MNARSVLAVLAACIVLSTGIGFAFGAAIEPKSAVGADSKASANTNKQLKQLRTAVANVQSDVDSIQTYTTRIGDSQDMLGSTLFGALDDINDDTDDLCRTISEASCFPGG